MAQAFNSPERQPSGDPAFAWSLYGIALSLIPGPDPGPSLLVEIQRAPDAAGVPGTWVTIDTVGPFPKSGGVYFDPRPKVVGEIWWYRARHVGATVDPGAYTNAVNASPYLIRQETIDSWSTRTSYPLPSNITLAGDTRSVLQLKMPALMVNGEFDVWEYYA